LFGASQFSVAGLTTVGAAVLSRQPVLAMALVIMRCALGALVFPLRILTQRKELSTC
jgi:hypothetical protein